MTKQNTWADLNDQFYASPAEATQRLIEANNQNLRREYNQADFFRQFYRRYPHLEADSAVVEHVLKANFDKLKDMPISEAMGEIADLVSQKNAADAKRRARRAPYEVYSGGPGFTGAAPVPDGDGQTLGSLIKERQARRRTASQGGWRAE